jgi:hypothetical protein
LFAELQRDLCASSARISRDIFFRDRAHLRLLRRSIPDSGKLRSAFAHSARRPQVMFGPGDPG